MLQCINIYILRIKLVAGELTKFNDSQQENAALRPYELAVQEATRSGLAMELIPRISATEDEKLKSEPLFADRWSVLQAVFFASTILTTIGEDKQLHSTFGKKRAALPTRRTKAQRYANSKATRLS
jgi:hypothetical protein